MPSGRSTVEPTREQLERAFRQMRRPGWPAELDVAMAQHTYAVCIRGLAVNLARGSPCVAGAGDHSAVSVSWQPPLRRPGGAIFDPRRAAANDRDDD